MQAGTLNRRVGIMAPSVEQDDAGQPIDTFAPLYQCWAGIRTATSKEVYAASGFVQQLSHVVTLRYPAVKITPGCKVTYEDRTFRVQAVSDPDESRVQLQLLCLEETP